MSEVNETAEAVMESLTGHDEMAIAQHFGVTVTHLVTVDPLMLSRAMVFVTRRRLEGVNDDDARNFALDLPFKAVMDYFADEADESEAEGKGEPDSELPLTTSPLSA